MGITDKDLLPGIFTKLSRKSGIIEIPEGYANFIKSEEKNSILLVFSNKLFLEAVNDSCR